MMRSMFTGVSGLRTHQTKMDVIGNNIANVNTVGYKTSGVTFKEIFSQTIQGASRANEETGRGGTNPMQIGLGVSIGSIDNLMTQGAAQMTDNPLDLMINGSSFFIVGDSSGQYFTRAGSFRLDSQGNLVNPAGLRVYGWNAEEDPENPGKQKVNEGKVQPLVIKSGENMQSDPVATSNIAFEGNLNMSDGQQDEGILRTMDFYDTLGNHYKIDVTLSFDAANGVWKFEPATKMTRNDTSTIAIDLEHPFCDLVFDSFGKLKTVDGETDKSVTIDLSNMTAEDLGVDAKLLPITIDFSGLTQFASQTTAKGASLDGCAAGTMTGFSIGPSGEITATYSNGRMKLLGQVAVANFRNPAGLEKVGDNLFTTTPNSGEFNGIGEDPTASGGSIGGGRLEMSNVDLAREFTEMITTQRGFQANSRVITTSDEILQDLVRLK